MADWKAVAQRQAISRSKYLYADSSIHSSHQPPVHLTTPMSCRDHKRATTSRSSRRVSATQAHRFAPYSLTPMVTGSSTLFSAVTTGKLERAIERGLAASTQRNYGAFVRKYLLFCDTERVSQSSIFPADELVLCAFVGSFAGEKSGSSANAAVSALKAWHRLHGVEWKGGYLLSHVLKGVAVLAPSSSQRPPRPPISLRMLQALRARLDLNAPFDSAVFAAALVAFWGQCRLGELLGSSRQRHDPTQYPSRVSFKFSDNPSLSAPGASVHLPCTKTHQAGGEAVHLTPQRDGLSPLSAVTSHFRVNASVPSSHHLFAYAPCDGQTRCLTREDFLDRCNAIWSVSGYSHMSGHSFRIGGTHAYLSSGVPCDVVKKMGRWSSDAFLKYWRTIGSIADMHAKNIAPTPNPTSSPPLLPRTGARRHTRRY